MARYNGSGWHNQSLRHSRARKYGKAGGKYAVFKKDKYGLNAEKVGDFNKKAFLVFDKNKFNIIKNPELEYNIVPRGAGWEHYPIEAGFKTEEEARDGVKKLGLDMRSVRITQSTKYKKHFGEPEKGDFDAGQVFQQLGGQRFIAMTGANNFIRDDNEKTITFKVPHAKDRIKYVRIRLTPNDTYDMEFLSRKGTLLRKTGFVYADKLQEVFTEYTGLDTHL